MIEPTTIVTTFPYRVRYADTDKMQYMYNGEYLKLFEIGRTELLRYIGLPYPELEKQGYMLPVIEARVFYNLPSYYDDELTIETTITVEYKPILQLNYRILRSDELIASGYTIHSFIDEKTRKSVRPPRVFFTKVETFSQSLSQHTKN
jgi:acyl-CoA thioester hydrolase